MVENKAGWRDHAAMLYASWYRKNLMSKVLSRSIKPDDRLDLLLKEVMMRFELRMQKDRINATRDSVSQSTSLVWYSYLNLKMIKSKAELSEI